MVVSTRARFAAAVAMTMVLALMLSGCGSDGTSKETGGQRTARSVILLIGDGMGQAHRTAARLYSVGRDGQLAMDTLPVTGTARTWATDNAVTDSASAGTALATGIKTRRQAIAVDDQGQPLPTILELAQKTGKSTGLVTNAALPDATPATFAAHNTDRNDYLGIALDMLDHNVDVLLGGGEDYFLPKGTVGCFPGDGSRTDGRNLIAEAEANGYEHVGSAGELSGVDPSATDKLFGTFADYEMARPYTPSLAEMTDKALAVLDKNSNGFFLMVEGDQIDGAAEHNDAVGTLSDVVGFDAAVRVALQYQSQHPETLVIVTADHATGGIAIENLPQDGPCSDPDPSDPRECRTTLHEDGPFSDNRGSEFWIDWTVTYHTGDDVPVMAIGPGSAALAGSYENTHVFEAMRDALGLAQ